MKLYSIKDWAKYYEASDNKKTDGPLSWVAVRTKTDGLGFRRVAAQKNRSDLFSAWHLMVGLAAKQQRENRGQLARNGRPLSPLDMEMMTGWPARVFEDALEFFSSQEQEWLEFIELSESVRTETDKAGQTPATLPTNQHYTTIPTIPETAAPSGSFGKSEKQLRVEAIFNRRPETQLSASERKAWKEARTAIEATPDDDMELVVKFYAAPESKLKPLYRRTSLATLINNWSGEIDKARKWYATKSEYAEAF